MYDDLVFLEKDFMGLIKYDRPTINRAYFHAMYHSFMYATAYRTAYNVSGEGVKRTVMDPQTLRRDCWGPAHEMGHTFQTDRKSTRLNSSHVAISYAVFCLKKKKANNRHIAL